MRSRGAWNGLAIVAVLTAIFVVTLFPTGTGTPSPFFFGFSLGSRNLGDAILNFFLFLPLGLAIGWNGSPATRAGLWGLVVASVIELAQMVLPGRDPALSDILLNASGTLVGAVLARRRRAWVMPDGRITAVLAATSISLLAAVMVVTAFLLSPAPSAEESVFIGRSGNDLLLRYPSRGGAYGFDQPEYWGSGFFESGVSGAPALASVSRDRARWEITIGSNRATIGPTVGRGWAVLAYPDAIGRRWGGVVSSVWLFAICLPAGFWARGRLRLPAALVVMLLLALIPAATGIGATSAIEWAGALLGFLAGVVLGEAGKRLSSRRGE